MFSLPGTVELVDFNHEAVAPVGDHYLSPEDLREGAVVAKASEVRAKASGPRDELRLDSLALRRRFLDGLPG